LKSVRIDLPNLADNEPTDSSTPSSEDRAKRSIPAHWIPLSLPNRNPIFGKVYATSRHQKIKDKKPGTIFIVVLDFARESMLKIHDLSARTQTPRTKEEREAIGVFEVCTL
jgi:hypothetical protein